MDSGNNVAAADLAEDLKARFAADERDKLQLFVYGEAKAVDAAVKASKGTVQCRNDKGVQAEFSR